MVFRNSSDSSNFIIGIKIKVPDGNYYINKYFSREEIDLLKGKLNLGDLKFVNKYLDLINLDLNKGFKKTYLSLSIYDNFWLFKLLFNRVISKSSYITYLSDINHKFNLWFIDNPKIGNEEFFYPDIRFIHLNDKEHIKLLSKIYIDKLQKNKSVYCDLEKYFIIYKLLDIL